MLQGLEQTGRVIPRRFWTAGFWRQPKRRELRVQENVLVTGFNLEDDAVKVNAKDSNGNECLRLSCS